MKTNQSAIRLVPTALMVGIVTVSAVANASSHREAPFISRHPKVDATDFYMFRSYEPGRDAYVALGDAFAEQQHDAETWLDKHR